MVTLSDVTGTNLFMFTFSRKQFRVQWNPEKHNRMWPLFMFCIWNQDQNGSNHNHWTKRMANTWLTTSDTLRVGLTRISSQLPVSDLGQSRHSCHFFLWQKNVTCHICHISGKNVTLSHTKIFFNLWRFLSHPSRKMSHFGPAGTKLFWSGRNVTIRLGLKHAFLFPSQICHLSRKREAGRPFGLRPTLS